MTTARTSSPLRIVLRILGAFFVLQGLGFLFTPQRAVEALGMTLLDGMARSTQLGDFAAFFTVLGGSILSGTRPGRAAALRFPATLLAAAAIGRTLAWVLQGAAFAGQFILVEIVGSALLFSASKRTDGL